MTLRPAARPTLVAVDALIDDVLLRTLEPAIAGLDRLFEAARYARHADGEPDGFDGVDRRGALHRLLASDWLLATEAPDEFLRRYQDGELAYLRLSAAVERRPQIALVLFDAGPEQLGRPRLAQLATLVVLARRAAAAGADLRWGTLQGPERHLAAGGHALDRFLAARSFAPVRELPLDAFVDDCLVVTPFTGPPRATRQLILREDGDGLVAVLADHGAATSRQAVLTLPRPEDGVRLLRDPTGTKTGPAVRGSPRPVSNLVFDQRGNKLLARVEPGRLAVYPVPRSPNDRPARIRYVATPARDGVILAAGRVRRAVLAVPVADGGEAVTVHRFGGDATAAAGTFAIEAGRVPPPGPDPPLGSLVWAANGLDIHLAGHRLIRTADGYRLEPSDGAQHWAGLGLRASATPTGGGWLVRAGDDEWTYRGETVYGVYVHVHWDGTRTQRSGRVVVAHPSSRALLGVGRDGREELYGGGEPIADAVVHPDQPILAVRTASGRVVVRSWLPGRTLYEVAPR